MFMYRWTWSAGRYCLLVLPICIHGCSEKSERTESMPAEDAPNVAKSEDVLDGPKSETRTGPPNDARVPMNIGDAVLDVVEKPDAAEENDVYEIPDCAVWVTFPDPDYEGPLPVQPSSSNQPCLCYPDGTSCTPYFWESCMWSSAPHIVDSNAQCPEGEICAGDNSFGPPFELGVCVRPCSHPAAAVNAPFACAASEECVVERVPKPGTRLPCSPDGMGGQCYPPDGFRTCEEAWNSLNVGFCLPKKRKQPYWDFSGCPPEDKPKPIFPVFPDASP